MSTLTTNFASLSLISSNREATKFKNITSKLGNSYASLYSKLQSASNAESSRDKKIVASARFIVVRSNDSKSLSIVDIQRQNEASTTHTNKDVAPKTVELLKPIKAISFSPFDDGLLASANTKGIDLYRIPCNENGTTASLAVNVDCVTSYDGSGCKLLGFNPLVDTCLSSVANNSEILVHDLNNIESPILKNDHFKDVHSFDWCIDASSMVVAAENDLGIIDIRSSDLLIFRRPSLMTAAKSYHTKWLGNTPYIISSILSQKRTKSVHLWDARNTNEPLSTVLDTQVSNGAWLPIFDPSNYVLYMVSTNDAVSHSVSHVNLRSLFDFHNEFISNSLERSVTTNQTSLMSKIIDATIVPTRSMRVNENEVSRLLLLLGNSTNYEEKIVPLSYCVPGKLDIGYKDELYLNVMKPDSLISFENWLNNTYSSKLHMTTMSLDPVIGNQIERHDVKLGSFSQQYESLEDELEKEACKAIESPPLKRNDVCDDLCQDLEENARIKEFEELTSKNDYYSVGHGARRIEHERLFISAVSKIVDFNEKVPSVTNKSKKDDEFNSITNNNNSSHSGADNDGDNENEWSD